MDESELKLGAEAPASHSPGKAKRLSARPAKAEKPAKPAKAPKSSAGKGSRAKKSDAEHPVEAVATTESAPTTTTPTTPTFVFTPPPAPSEPEPTRAVAPDREPLVEQRPAPVEPVDVPSVSQSEPTPESSTSASAAETPTNGDGNDAGATTPVESQSEATAASAGVFQPTASGGGAPSVPGSPPLAEEEPWWKRKRDKKKQKWLERQQNRGAQHQQHQGQPPAQVAKPQSTYVAKPQPAYVAKAPQPPPPVQAHHYGDLPNPARFADLTALDALAAELGGGQGEPFALDRLYSLHLADLTAQARGLGVTLEGMPNRLQALEAVLRFAATQKIPLRDSGWLDVTDRGFGFIVHEHVNYRLLPENSYVPESLIRRYGLKRGHRIEAVAQAPQPGERCPAVVGIRSVMGRAPEEAARVMPFEELVPYYPLKRILLEATEIDKDISMRAIDLLTPVGFGQRGLIVAPPRTGKTVLLHNIANSVSNNYPEARLIILLVDERPEEVTDFRRHTKGEVVSSTFDEAPESHVHAAEMVIEKARRLVELGEHVVILLDSITRLARAYNALAANSGKIMSGGLEATALQKPKRFFGSARNIEGGGSLTILGTALIDTGSRMDEIIFEEFKGTGNMELHLDRGLSDKRIFPAINIDRSGTRKEELIYHPEEMLRVYGLRRAMQGIPPVEAMDMLIQRLKKTKTNAEFLLSLNR